MKQLIHTVAVFSMVASVAVLAACSGATRSGTSYTLKADRELEAYLPGNIDRVHTTAEKVLKEKLQYRIVRSVKDAREGIIEALTAKGDTVRVETYRSTDTVTRTEVFVGPFGNQDAMREVLDAISKALGK